MWEIIADPEDYGIEVLEEGINNNNMIEFAEDNRKVWAEEIGVFATRLNGLAERAITMRDLLASQDPIVATPASLKTLKVTFFKINDALNTAIELAEKLETQIVKK
jgi:hypothetical protein